MKSSVGTSYRLRQSDQPLIALSLAVQPPILTTPQYLLLLPKRYRESVKVGPIIQSCHDGSILVGLVHVGCSLTLAAALLFWPPLRLAFRFFFWLDYRLDDIWAPALCTPYYLVISVLHSDCFQFCCSHTMSQIDGISQQAPTTLYIHNCKLLTISHEETGYQLSSVTVIQSRSTLKWKYYHHSKSRIIKTMTMDFTNTFFNQVKSYSYFV